MEGIEKLPKWAQEKVRNLERERDVAVRKLREWEDSQTPSPFQFWDHVCDGDQGTGPSRRVQYVQAHTMDVVHNGVRLSVILRDEGIDLQYDAERRHMGRVSLVPKSYQQVMLEAVDWEVDR